MTRSRDLNDLLTRSRPAQLDPPPNRNDAHAVAAIVADESPAAMHAEPRRRRTPMRVLTTAGATAVVVAVAVAGGVITSRDPAPDTSPDAGVAIGTSPAPRAGSGDAGRLLLAAAERTDTAAPSGGRYLNVQSEVGVAWQVPAAGGPYTMIHKTLNQYWLARPGAGRSWVMVQSLGVTPATANDEAAWQRAGSPTTVKVPKPKPAELQTTPGKLQGNPVDTAQMFAIGSRNVSLKQLNSLPTDPAALRKALLSDFDGGGGDMPTDRGQWLLGVTASLVVDLPVSDSVRAAAYRLLAELPGVRELGTVRDVRGRTGQAVAFTQDSPQVGSSEVRLIIDADTGRALAQEHRAVRPGGNWAWISPGALIGYQAVLVSKHTDDNPPKVDVEN